MINLIKEDTLNEQSQNNARNSDADFKRFVMTCKKELKLTGWCVCFNLEQVEELKKDFNLKYVESGGIYYVEVEKMIKLIIDTKSDEKHYVVLKEDGKQFCLIAKSNNTLDDVKRFIGTMNIKEVI